MSPKIPETQKAIVFYKNGGDLTYEDINMNILQYLFG